MLDNRMVMKFASILGISSSSIAAQRPHAASARPTTQYYTTPSKHGPSLQPLSPGMRDDGDPDACYPPLTAPPEAVGPSLAPFQRRERIAFYDKNKPFYEFTNFSPHEIVYGGKRYPTSEHLFQSFKFLDSQPAIAEHIRKCDGPRAVFDEAHRHQKWVRSDWRQVNVEKMEVTLRLKFTQHADLRAMLLGTRDAELVEDSPRDYFWGVGADGSGRNELGKALERLRDELRHENRPIRVPPVKRDTSRYSLQDLTSLIVATTSRPPAQAPQLSIVPAGMAISPQSTSVPDNTGLCEFCHQKAKYPGHPYCGRTCATNAATMCIHCNTKPKYGKHPYCSRTCAVLAGKAT